MARHSSRVFFATADHTARLKGVHIHEFSFKRFSDGGGGSDGGRAVFPTTFFGLL